MKKIIVTILMVFAMIGSAMGYVVDGNLNDWGVDLTQSWGSFSTWDVADADIDFIVEDNIDPRLDTAYWVNQKLACDWTCYFGYDDFCSCNYGIHKSTFNGNTNNYVEPFVYSKGKDDYNGDGRMTPPTTGELYDNEALYCDNDANNIYLAIVTSFPKNGANARIDTTTYYNQGDIGFDFNNDGYMEYGIKVKGSNEGKICKNPKWTAVDKDEDNWKSETEPFYWEFSCTNTNSQWTGTGSISYVDQGFNENENDIFVIEVKVPRSAVGNPVNGDEYVPFIVQECGNDPISFKCDIDINKCGDGIIQNPNDHGQFETCDDGNNVDGDGCSSTCEVEIPPRCGDNTCDAGETCELNGATNDFSCPVTPSAPSTILTEGTCRSPLDYSPELACTYCGDGIIQPNSGEDCDGTAGVQPGETCTSECKISVDPYCGDGDINNGELCDDGTENNGNVCSVVYKDSPPPDTCSYCSAVCEPVDIEGPFCGDEIVQPEFETCDDGNDIDDDECNNICEPNHEVPEFTTIGAGLALLGAAGIAMRRKKN